MYRDEAQSMTHQCEMLALSLGILEWSRPFCGLGASQAKPGWSSVLPPWDSASFSSSCAKRILKYPLHGGCKHPIPHAKDFSFLGTNGVLMPQEHCSGAKGRKRYRIPLPGRSGHRAGTKDPPPASRPATRPTHGLGAPSQLPRAGAAVLGGLAGVGGCVWPRTGLVSAKRPPPAL